MSPLGPRLGPMMAALAAGAAAGLAAVIAPRWGGPLAVLAVPAAITAAGGTWRQRTWPASLAVGAIGAGYCASAASRPVDVSGTCILAGALFAAFQLSTPPGARVSGRSPSSIVLVLLATAAGPVVLVSARASGGVGSYLYLPALAAGVTAVVAPVLIVARLARGPRPDSG